MAMLGAPLFRGGKEDVMLGETKRIRILLADAETTKSLDD